VEKGEQTAAKPEDPAGILDGRLPRNPAAQSGLLLPQTIRLRFPLNSLRTFGKIGGKEPRTNPMQIFLWLTVIIILCVATFAVQNSAAPPLTIKFLFWKLETSLIPMLLGSIGAGILIMLLLWIPKALRASFRVKALKKEMESLQAEAKRRLEEAKEESKKKPPEKQP
jgi:uncharacterized integral membrane protein